MASGVERRDASAAGSSSANGTPASTGSAELGAKAAVERVAAREEHRERVGAAVEEDGDEDLLRAGCGRGGDPFLEGARQERRAAVDGEREAGGAGEEAAAVEAGTGRKRHAGLDRGQPAAGLGDGAPEELGAREVVAAAGHRSPYEVWRSGDTAISWRRRVRDEEAVARLLPLRVGIGHRLRREAEQSAACVAGRIVGLPQNASAPSTSACGSAGSAADCLSVSEYGWVA